MLSTKKQKHAWHSIKSKLKSYDTETAALLVILIAIGLHLHLHGMKENRSPSAAKGNTTQEIKEGVKQTIGCVAPLADILNTLLLEFGMVTQPLVLASCFKSVGTAAFPTILQKILHDMMPIGSVAVLYQLLFHKRYGVLTTSSQKKGNRDSSTPPSSQRAFNLSGHALIGHTIVLSLRKLGDSPAEKRLKKMWFVAYACVSTLTIVYYHTVPEYMAGVALAYGYDALHQSLKHRPKNTTLYSHLKKKLTRKSRPNKIRTKSHNS
jgi:hypothetical protein